MGWLSLDRVTKTHGWSSIGDSFVTSCLRTSEGEEGKGLMLCMCLVSGAPEQARIIRSSNIIVEWAYMSNYADKFITSCLRRRREQRSSCEQATNYDCMAAPRFLEPSLTHCAANIRRLIGAISTQLVFCYASCIIQKMHIAGAHYTWIQTKPWKHSWEYRTYAERCALCWIPLQGFPKHFSFSGRWENRW